MVRFIIKDSDNTLLVVLKADQKNSQIHYRLKFNTFTETTINVTPLGYQIKNGDHIINYSSTSINDIEPQNPSGVPGWIPEESGPKIHLFSWANHGKFVHMTNQFIQSFDLDLIFYHSDTIKNSLEIELHELLGEQRNWDFFNNPSNNFIECTTEKAERIFLGNYQDCFKLSRLDWHKSKSESETEPKIESETESETRRETDLDNFESNGARKRKRNPESEDDSEMEQIEEDNSAGEFVIRGVVLTFTFWVGCLFFSLIG